MKLQRKVASLLAIAFLFLASSANAQIVGTGDKLKSGINSGLKEAAGGAFEVGGKNAAAGDVLLSQIFVQWMNIAIGALGLVAVVLFVYAGYLWLTAGGESGPIQKQKQS